MLTFLFHVIKDIILILVCAIGLPIYGICVLLLLTIGKIFDISYIDASVYVCEYGQPIVTAVAAIVVAVYCIKYSRGLNNTRLFLIWSIILSNLAITGYSLSSLLMRINQYKGLTNRQIFNTVVDKLNKIGEGFIPGNFDCFGYEKISYGYVMANIEAYILPISLVILLFIIARKWILYQS